jgi:NADPH:quinone reductase-like Zn-dependent oxidoreductase
MMAEPDPATLHTYAEDAKAGKFTIPVSRVLSLREAGEAQAMGEKGGAGKLILVP